MVTAPEPADAADDVRTVAVLGIGTMGSTIAWMLARHGLDVVVTDSDVGLTAAGLARIGARAEADPSPEERSIVAARIAVAPDIETAVSSVDLVIEATSENRDVKEDVLRRSAGGLPAHAILATNKSSYPIDLLADFLPAEVRPRFVGLHFFNPADLVPGVEVITHEGTAGTVVNTCMELMRRVGKRPSLVRSSPGFVANRLQLTLFREAVACVEEGVATHEEIDTIVSNTFGYRLPAFGPFQIADMAGLDVYMGIFEVLEHAFGERFAAPDSLAALVHEGHLGLKSGQGYATHTHAAASARIDRRDAAYRAIASAMRDLNSTDVPIA